MIINSFSFIIFFTVLFLLYFVFFKNHQTIVLLLGSFVFIASYKIEYLLLMIIIGTISYITPFFMKKMSEYAKCIMAISICIQLIVLFYFKYLNFTIGVIFRIQKYFMGIDVAINDTFFKILLPVGISFYIFQSIGYLVDVYRGKTKIEKSWIIYILFLSYFPKLPLGPIERADSLMPQLKVKHEFNYSGAVEGLRICLVGLFKKIAIADSIAVIVNNVYDNCYDYLGLPLIVATILYSFQIYCDFSGYADMAIGVSKILGIRLMENFKSPYLSTSITEFWRRWHISLSTWFRDYVYIPLGGNRVKLPRYLVNTVITMTISGIWHGANMTFVIWGFLNGLLLCLEKLINRKRMSSGNTVKTIIKLCITFSLICITWIFFRANSIHDAIYIVANLFSGIEFSLEYIKMSIVNMGLSKFYCLIISIALAIQIIIDVIHDKFGIQQYIAKKKIVYRWVIYCVVLIFIIVCKIYTAESQQFIYFNF